MTRNTKILIGLFGGLLGLCLCGILVSVTMLGAAGALIARSVTTEPAQVLSIAGGIANYDLPAGWKEEYAANVLGCTMVEIGPDHPRGHVFLVQLPAGLAIDAATIREQLRETERTRHPDGHEGGERIQVVGQQDVTIRGQAVKLVVSEGTNSAGDPYREWTGLFSGRNGQVFLSISAPIANWDAAAIEGFIASIE